MTHCLPFNSLILPTYFVFFWIHFLNRHAVFIFLLHTLFVWKRFKMFESAYICINCNYTISIVTSFSLLFPSNQSCVSKSVQSTVCYPCMNTVQKELICTCNFTPISLKSSNVYSWKENSNFIKVVIFLWHLTKVTVKLKGTNWCYLFIAKSLE